MKTDIELAKQVSDEGYAPVLLHAEVRRLCELVRADEREACAKVAEDKAAMVIALLNVTSQPIAIAAAIRNRSNT